MTSNPNDVFDDLCNEEQRHRQIGFEKGYSLGEEVGWKDGFVFGLKKGAQIAAELGFYQGFVHAWIEILEKEDEVKQRKLVALKTLLEMTRQFPKYNLKHPDAAQLLTRIRAKFKQVNSLLKYDYSSNPSFNTSSEENEEFSQNFTNFVFNQPSTSYTQSAKKSPTPNFNSNRMNEMSF